MAKDKAPDPDTWVKGKSGTHVNKTLIQKRYPHTPPSSGKSGK